MILIVGLGSIAIKHIAALKKINQNILLFALRSKINAEIIEGVTNIYALSELISTPKFAIISNPTNAHYNTIETLINLKIPLFIEKPPLHSLINSENLLEQLNDNNIITYVACNLRFHPCIHFLKNNIESNKQIINEINIYCGSYLPNWRTNNNYKTIYSANKEMGGGVHLDLFHEIDYAIWLFGKPQIVNSVQTSKSSLEINATDYANYILQYPKFNISIVLNYFRIQPKRTIEILFNDDIWLVDLLKCEIKNSKNEIVFTDEKYQIANTYLLQMQYFMNCLNDNKTPMNTFKEALESLKICLVNE